MTPNLRNNLTAAGVTLAAFAAFAVIGHVVTSAGNAAHTITLSVRGGGTMDVTYIVGDKNSQDTAAASPWQASYQINGDIPYAGITAQNSGSGSITCTITEDGQVVNSNTAYGAYAVVQCTH
jgi:hypothetical protein